MLAVLVYTILSGIGAVMLTSRIIDGEGSYHDEVPGVGVSIFSSALTWLIVWWVASSVDGWGVTWLVVSTVISTAVNVGYALAGRKYVLRTWIGLLVMLVNAGIILWGLWSAV